MFLTIYCKRKNKSLSPASCKELTNLYNQGLFESKVNRSINDKLPAWDFGDVLWIPLLSKNIKIIVKMFFNFLLLDFVKPVTFCVVLTHLTLLYATSYSHVLHHTLKETEEKEDIFLYCSVWRNDNKTHPNWLSKINK